MRKRKIIPYGNHFIDKADILSVVKTLKSPFLTQGPKIEEFEKCLAKKCGAKYAVVVNSGTAALHTAYFAIGLTKEDEFVTTPMTFAATGNAGLYLGAKPVFVDILPNGNIDESKIENKITKKTKMIVPVHYGGNPANLEKIRKIAKRHNLFVVEDAAHALGAKYKQSKIGDCSFSDMCVLSFHPVKHITTGEGGAILTNDEKFYKRMLMFRTHGITKKNFINKSEKEGDWYYEMQNLGFNYRLTDIQAALGLSQLKKLDKFVEQRRKIASIYKKRLNDNPFFDIPADEAYINSSFHLYPILLKDKYKKFKKEIFQNLRKNKLGVQVHYIPIYFHPYYYGLGYKRGKCPVAEDFYQKEISIPIYPAMKKKDIDQVVAVMNNVLTSIK